MTRKDYITIADAICYAKPENQSEVDLYLHIIDNVTAVFKQDNPNFDKLRFYYYCNERIGV